MGTLSCETLIDDVQAAVGRVGDTKLVTDARVTRWLNEGQRHITRKSEGLDDLDFKNVETFDFSENEILFPIADMTFSTPNDTTDEQACHIRDAWYVDGAESVRLDYLPIDEFDNLLIDPTSSDHSADKPARWTRRGDYIEIAPRPSSTYSDVTTKVLRLDGTRYPQEFTTNDSSSSEISDVDEGLIRYGVWQAWGYIGNTVEEIKAKKRFSNPNPLPGEDFGWLEDWRDSKLSMPAWDGDVVFSEE